MFISFLIWAVVFFAVFVALLRFYANRVAGVAITSKFQAAEAISNGTIPDQWVKQINRRGSWGSIPTRFLGHAPAPEEFLIKKLDDLYQFFETCPFVESPEVRKLLLDELEQTRDRWVNKSWEEIELASSGKETVE